MLNNIWNEFFAGFCADFSEFWAVPKAIQVWKNILKHCWQILDNIPASMKITSSMISWPIIFVADVLPFLAMPDEIRRWENILKDCWCILDNFPASIVAKYTCGSIFMISWHIIFVANVLPFWTVPNAIQRWKNSLKHCRRILDQFLASIGAKYTSGSIIFVANVLPFWAMPDAIRRWENILKHCRRILDQFLASIGAKYTSSSNFTIYWPIIFVADVLPFWAVLDAIRRWENILKHCQRILDQFPASIVAKYTSSSNFMISWPIIFVANVLPFWAVPNAIWRWENILKHCWRILDNFLASLSSNYISGSIFMISWHIIFVADVLPFWAVPDTLRKWENILKHCQRILANFLASLLANYISGSNFIISWPIIFAADVLPFWAVAKGNPSVGKHSETLPKHFLASISAKYTCCHNFIISFIMVIFHHSVLCWG